MKYDPAKIRTAYDDARQRALAERHQYERLWLKNILFYCFAEGTKVPLLDDRHVPIEELVGQENLWLYGFDLEALRIIPAQMLCCVETGERECIEVALDNGNSFVCTPDHQILTWFGYKRAGELEIGTPLVPWRSKYYKSTSPSGQGYNQIFQPYDAEWQQTHRMVAAYIYGEVPKEFVIHHVNEIKRDNRPENLQPMSKKEHSILTLETHKTKVVEGGRQWHRRPENRKRAAENAAKQWRENREKMLAANREFRSRPEFIAHQRAMSQEWWKIPGNRERRVAQMAARWAEKKGEINCRVVGIIPVGKKRVFDLSVPDTENFALEAGIFAHNCGIQWIQYSTATHRWVPKPLKKWIPKVCTNKFSAASNTIMQVLSSKAPELAPQPQTDNEDDIASAEIAERLLPVLDDESDVRTARKQASFWITLTGNCFLHPCYDADMQQGSTFVQHLRCMTCGKVVPPDDAPEGNCPSCQSPNLTEAYTPKGEPLGEEMPRGTFPVEVFSPFEIFLDLEARSMNEVQEILVRRRYPVEKIRQQFKLPGGGEIEPDSPGSAGQGGVGLNYLRSIAYAATGTGYPSAYGLGVTSAEQQGVTVDYFWKRPTSDFPKGLCVPFANEQILERQSKDYDSKYEIPYKDKQGIPIWPWHQLIFDRVGGRIYGRTPMDDVAPKQEQRNKLESLILLIASRMSVPHWLIGKDTGIATITGDPGQVIEWNSRLGRDGKPELLQGAGVPTSLVALLEKCDSDIEALAGVFDVLRGNAPPGVSAGTALRLLLERAVTRFTPVIEEFEYVWGRVQRDRLIIFQQFGTDERMAKIQGPGKTWEIQRFNNSDLRGCVDVKVEAGSMLPKSAVGQQALIQDMASMGVIMPQEPETQYKILQQFGATNLLGPRDDNIKQAERENWRFVHDQIPPQINPVIDDHETHWNVHLKLALTSDFETWPDEMKIAWLHHMQEHKQAILAAMMPQMQAVQPVAPAGKLASRGNGSNGSSRRGPAPAAQEGASPEGQPEMAGGPF